VASRGCFEDIPEKNRDASMWVFAVKYAPVYLEMTWKGFLDGREELLAPGSTSRGSKA
jgi:hypothetical protein